MAGRTPAGIFCNGVFNLFWLHLCRQGCKGKGDICLPAQSLPLPRGGVSEADGEVDGTKHSNADSVCTVGTDLPGGPNIRTVFKTDRRGRRSLQCEKGLPYSRQAKNAPKRLQVPRSVAAAARRSKLHIVCPTQALECTRSAAPPFSNQTHSVGLWFEEKRKLPPSKKDQSL